MSLLERLTGDMKEAMKAKDKVRTQVLRMVISEVKYAQAAVSMSEKLDEPAVQKVVASYHKKLTKSLSDYPEGDQRDAINHEIAIVEEYLPKKASPAEVEGFINELLKNTNDREFGTLMKQVMAKFGAAADGKTISELLKKKLS